MNKAPWSATQVRVVAACDVAAIVLLLVSASEARGNSLGDQVLWLNVAVLSTLLAVVANGSLFLIARRAIGRRRLSLVPDVDTRLQQVALPSDVGSWYRVPGTTRAHRLGCQMIEDKPRRLVAADVIRAEGLRRCEICG